MRNWIEGVYTRWHVDIGFSHLHPFLQRLYPKLRTLPSIEAVLEWHQKYERWVALLRTGYAEDVQQMQDRTAATECNDLRRWLEERERQWSPPPDACAWKTPVPREYFTAAAGVLPRWRLDETQSSDLVPVEQSELVQDVLELHLSLIHI